MGEFIGVEKEDWQILSGCFKVVELNMYKLQLSANAPTHARVAGTLLRMLTLRVWESRLLNARKVLLPNQIQILLSEIRSSH
jgi:hypothetical protein